MRHIRPLLLAGLFGLTFALTGHAALAADKPARTTVVMAPINCDALNTGTLICVRNATAETINKIDCSGMWGASTLSIPRGVIKSGETTVVDFAKGKCTKRIVVFTRDGHQYPFEGFDTTQNTVLLVDPE